MHSVWYLIYYEFCMCYLSEFYVCCERAHVLFYLLQPFIWIVIRNIMSVHYFLSSHIYYPYCFNTYCQSLTALTFLFSLCMYSSIRLYFIATTTMGLYFPTHSCSCCHKLFQKENGCINGNVFKLTNQIMFA